MMGIQTHHGHNMEKMGTTRQPTNERTGAETEWKQRHMALYTKEHDSKTNYQERRGEIHDKNNSEARNEVCFGDRLQHKYF